MLKYYSRQADSISSRRGRGEGITVILVRRGSFGDPTRWCHDITFYMARALGGVSRCCFSAD